MISFIWHSGRGKTVAEKIPRDWGRRKELMVGRAAQGAFQGVESVFCLDCGGGYTTVGVC